MFGLSPKTMNSWVCCTALRPSHRASSKELNLNDCKVLWIGSLTCSIYSSNYIGIGASVSLGQLDRRIINFSFYQVKWKTLFIYLFISKTKQISTSFRQKYQLQLCMDMFFMASGVNKSYLPTWLIKTGTKFPKDQKKHMTRCYTWAYHYGPQIL